MKAGNEEIMRKARINVFDTETIKDLRKIKEPSLKSIIFHESKRSGKYFVIEIIDMSWEKK